MSSGQRYELIVRPAVARQIRALDKPLQAKIKVAAEALRIDPRPAGCRKMTVGKDLWRIRVGDYRVIYQVDDGVLVVTLVKAGNRRDIYR